jgi:hypothetical protein
MDDDASDNEAAEAAGDLTMQEETAGDPATQTQTEDELMHPFQSAAASRRRAAYTGKRGKKQVIETTDSVSTAQDDDSKEETSPQERRKKQRSPPATITAVAAVPAVVITSATTLRSQQPPPQQVQPPAQPAAVQPALVSTSADRLPTTHQRLASDSSAAPIPAAAPAAAASSQPTQQRQQQPPKGGSSNRPPLPRPAPLPSGLKERCNEPEESPTSLVLRLTPNTPAQRRAAAAWRALPRPAEQNNRSLVAVATVLTKLRINAPPMPLVLNSCNTIQELADKLMPADSDDQDSETPLRDVLFTAAATSYQALAAFLYNNADDIAVATGAPAKAKGWVELFTPYTASMSRKSTTQQQAAVAAVEGQREDNGGGVIRLDFATLPARLYVQFYLASLAESAHNNNGTSDQSSGLKPQTGFTVELYRRRLIAAQVTGFVVGPLTVDPTRRFTALDELHGNWPLLREWLAKQAPHCTPACSASILNNGTGAVEFVLEESHRHELHELNKRIDADNGITRPLNLSVHIWRRSPHVACSMCGGIEHTAHQCTKRPRQTQTGRLQQPQAQQLSCKSCFSLDHTANECTAARHCNICKVDGHSTLQCSKYRPRWVEEVMKQQPTPRSTNVTDRVSLLRGVTPPQRPTVATSAWLNKPRLSQPASPTNFSSSTAETIAVQQQSQRLQQPEPSTQPSGSDTTMRDVIQLLTKQLAAQQEETKALRQEMSALMRMMLEIVKSIPGLQHPGPSTDRPAAFQLGHTGSDMSSTPPTQHTTPSSSPNYMSAPTTTPTPPTTTRPTANLQSSGSHQSQAPTDPTPSPTPPPSQLQHAMAVEQKEPARDTYTSQASVHSSPSPAPHVFNQFGVNSNLTQLIATHANVGQPAHPPISTLPPPAYSALRAAPTSHTNEQ